MNTILVAWDQNRLIGSNNGLPWKIKEDLKLFKERTHNHAIIMGKNTWDSLGRKALLNRVNVVVSTTLLKSENLGCYVFDSLKEGIDLGRMLSQKDEVFIIGGSKIYESVLDAGLVNRMLVSIVRGNYIGDVFFPKFDMSQWDIKVLEKYDEFDVMEYNRLK